MAAHDLSRLIRLALLALPLAHLVNCAPSPSVDVRQPEVAPRSVVVADVAVLDVETGARTPGRDVLLEGGFIREIGRSGALGAPEGALVIDGSAGTLVPGLVDMHGHVNADRAPTWDAGIPDPEASLRAFLYSGVTTVLDPGDPSPEAFERRARVAQGALIGPRIYTAGPLLTCPGGHPVALVEAFAPWWIRWYLVPRVAVALDSKAKVEEVVDRLAADGADVIKIIVDQIPLTAPRMSVEIMRAVVARAESHGLRTIAHIGTTQDALDAAEAGVAAWAHGVYKERIPDDQIPVLASFGIPMIATIEVFDRYARAGDAPWDPTPLETQVVPREILDSYYPTPDDFDIGALESWLELARAGRAHQADNVRRLREAGVTILAGSDPQTGVFAGPGLHRELRHLVRAGMTPAQAIRAATLDSARFLAAPAEPDFGSVTVGKRADLVLVDGDPTSDVAALEQIREVFVGGVPLERSDIATVSARAD